MKFDIGLALKRWFVGAGIGSLIGAASPFVIDAVLDGLKAPTFDWRAVAKGALIGILAAAKTDHAAFTEAVKTNEAQP